MFSLTTSTVALRAPPKLARSNTEARGCTCRAQKPQEVESAIARRDVLRVTAAAALTLTAASPAQADTYNQARNDREARKQALLAAARAKATGEPVPDIPDYEPIGAFDIQAGKSAPKPKAAAAEKKDLPSAPKPKAKKVETAVEASKKPSADERAAAKAELLAAARAKALAQAQAGGAPAAE